MGYLTPSFKGDFFWWRSYRKTKAAHTYSLVPFLRHIVILCQCKKSLKSTDQSSHSGDRKFGVKLPHLWHKKWGNLTPKSLNINCSQTPSSFSTKFAHKHPPPIPFLHKKIFPDQPSLRPGWGEMFPKMQNFFCEIWKFFFQVVISQTGSVTGTSRLHFNVQLLSLYNILKFQPNRFSRFRAVAHFSHGDKNPKMRNFFPLVQFRPKLVCR